METLAGRYRGAGTDQTLRTDFSDPERVAKGRLPKRPTPTVEDRRIQRLLGAAAWSRLPAPVQQRFSSAMRATDVKVYSGTVKKTTLSRWGRTLAALARVIGSPLPLDHNAHGPALVAVTQDPVTGDQYWVRTYTRPGKRPQVVSSAKRFRGPTGLEEYVGYGIGMTLRLQELNGDLLFCSDRFFIEWRRWRLYLPQALSPGEMTICHRQKTPSSFIFELTLQHPKLGLLLHQVAQFQDQQVPQQGAA
jgi:Domain of unknown function (DUF4166)